MQSSHAIRPERPADLPRIEAIVHSAFGRPDEAQLVNALRRSASPFLSLVALHGDHVVGHVALSPVAIEGPRPGPTSAGVAPLSVLPESQRQGIGAALMEAALSACSSVGWEAVFLLGDPLYYARFGFEVAAPRGLHYESHAFDHAFQCREIRRGALVGVTGWVRYHEAFAGL